MSNDLISRSAMIKKICGSKCGCNMEECGDDICEAVEMVKEIPTAYDVEKVVEQLEEAMEKQTKRGFEYMNAKENKDMSEVAFSIASGLKEAIEIVKKGGAE